MATQADVQALMEFLSAEYETFQVTAERLGIWTDLLASQTPEALLRGAKHFLTHSGSAYAPTVSQLIRAIHDSKPLWQPPRVRSLEAPKMSEETKQRLREEARRKYPHLFN